MADRTDKDPCKLLDDMRKQFKALRQLLIEVKECSERRQRLLDHITHQGDDDVRGSDDERQRDSQHFGQR